MMNISRRWLLSLIGLITIFAGSGWRHAAAQLFFKPRRKVKPRSFNDPYREGGKLLVGIAGGGTVVEMVKEAVSLIGGLKKIGVDGKTILVKPNVVSGESPPATTNPEVVRAVVELLFHEGASRVIVGDMSALLTLSTKRNFKRTGIKEAAEAAKAKVVYFEDYDWVEVELPGSRYIERVYVTEWIYNVDAVINLPVIKTHRSASYSICLKNFIGCTHLKQRPYLIDSSHWEELISDINLAYRPHLNIVDGTTSMVEGGPWEGTVANTNLIIAGGNRVATDIVGLGIIKSLGRWAMVTEKDVWEQRQIIHANKLGFGTNKKDIKILAKSINYNKEFNGLLDKIRFNTGITA